MVMRALVGPPLLAWTLWIMTHAGLAQQDAPWALVQTTQTEAVPRDAVLDASPAASSPPSAPDADSALAAPPPVAPFVESEASPANGAELINAERLTIKVQGYPDLSGEYRVNADATISIPVIGRVSVASSDASKLERTLAERVTNVAGREAFVTVEIAQYRPIFVSGYVRTPGTTPWRPDMTVLHAVTMAGGTFRAGGDSAAMLAGDVEATRLQRASADLKRVLATLARLKAEQAGAVKLESPPRLLELAEPQEAQQLIETQNSTFMARKTAIETQVGTLGRAIEASVQELDGLREQSLRLKEQLQLRRGLQKKLDGLVAKGIVRAERGMEELIRIADLEEKSTNVVVAIARVQNSLILMRREADGIRQGHQASIDTEIQKLERDAAQLEIDIAAARTAYRKITGGSPNADAASEANKKIVIEYQIVRREEGQTRSERADQLTILKPGDMVVVNAN